LPPGSNQQFAVTGLIDPTAHAPACGPDDLAGRTLAGVADFEPELYGNFTMPVTIDIPIDAEQEHQMVGGEVLELRYCDSITLWTSSGTATSDGVQPNQYVPGRTASDATLDPADNLALWGVFFVDDDEDGARDEDCGGAATKCCDCAAGNTDLWEPPTAPRDLKFLDDTTLSWTAPEHPGASPGVLRYDAIRTTDPQDFVVTGECEEEAIDITITQATVTIPPGPGEVFYYAVRSENPCDPGFTNYRNCRNAAAQREALDCGLSQGQ
jgi:hypothetical protein